MLACFLFLRCGAGRRRTRAARMVGAAAARFLSPAAPATRPSAIIDAVPGTASRRRRRVHLVRNAVAQSPALLDERRREGSALSAARLRPERRRYCDGCDASSGGVQN